MALTFPGLHRPSVRRSGSRPSAASSNRLLDQLVGGGEAIYRALYPVALARQLHRINRVIVGRARIQAHHPHPENRIWMTRVQPDMRFRRPAQILGICSVVDDAPMLVGASGVIAAPSDNGPIAPVQFELRPFGYLGLRGAPEGRLLSRGWSWEEQAADHDRDR